MTTALPFIVPEGVTCEGVNCPNGKQCALKANGQQSGCVDPESDPCSPNPCQNGGICNANSGDFTCSCASGYVGDDCGITTSSKLQEATSEKESPQTSVEYSSQLSQQHSIVTTQVNQQQSMELSTQKQRAAQQTSESQQLSTLPSLEHLSLVTQQYSTMTTQAYLPQLQLSVANIPLPSLQTLKTTYTQQQQPVGTSLLTQVPPQPSGSYSVTQSQQETQLLSASRQAALLVSVEASTQSTQQGLSHQTKVLSSPSKQITGQPLATLQPSSTTSKEEIQIVIQQTSGSQQAATLLSLEHLSMVAQQYSTMTTQAYLSRHQPSVPNISYSVTQSQQETRLLSASQQAALLVSAEASPQSTQRGLSQETEVLPSPSKQTTGQPLATLQPSPTTLKEELKYSSPSQPQQQQNQSNYPHSQATKASSVSPVTHVLNGSSISPGIEYICYLDICQLRINAYCKT